MAAQSLDRARLALADRIPNAADAVTLRATKPSFSPDETVTIQVGWAYPVAGDPVSIRVGGSNANVKPQQVLNLPVAGNWKREQSTVVVAKVGGESRAVRIVVIKDLRARLLELRSSQSRVARDLGAGIERAASTGTETDLPIRDMLVLAEKLNSGKSLVSKLEEFPYAVQGSNVLRAYVPKGAASDATVVIALHGAGGSENLFFEGYGNGLAVKEAKTRGWVFLSPRSAPGAADAALAWLKEVRGIVPKRLLVMGHSMGGGIALTTANLKPDALALFAPAAMRIPAELASTPIFLAVGQQEIMMLRANSAAMGKSLGPNCEFRVYDPCEHLMIVADAVGEAYRFFDKVLKVAR
jgi:predicted esterase